MSADELLDCVACGACCFSDNPRAVRVMGADHARLGEALAARYTEFIEHRCYMRVEAGRCAALQVTVDGRYLCAVYPLRPEVCRDLERGGRACGGERWEKLGRTLVALEAVRARAAEGRKT